MIKMRLLLLLLLPALLLAACDGGATGEGATSIPGTAVAPSADPTSAGDLPGGEAPPTTFPPTETPPAAPPTGTPAPTSEGPVTLQIKADGSGDLVSLQEALAIAAPGSTIQLSPGTFDLPQTLVVDKPLTIRGAGRAETRLAAFANEAVIAYGGDGVLALSDLTISHIGGAAADIINMEAGELQLSGCRLEGGKRAQQQAFYGAAVFARNESLVTAFECDFLGNEGAAVEAIHSAQVTITNSLLSGNGGGILLDNNSSGVISGNTIERNLAAGIYLYGRATAEIRGNLIRENGEYGISYDLDGEGGGTAAENVLFSNDLLEEGDPGTDIIVHDQASPLLTGNNCSPNDGALLPVGEGEGVNGSGIVYFFRGLVEAVDYDLEANNCLVTVCGLEPTDEEELVLSCAER